MITPRGMSNARETTMVARLMLFRSPWLGLGAALSLSGGTEESLRVVSGLRDGEFAVATNGGTPYPTVNAFFEDECLTPGGHPHTKPFKFGIAYEVLPRCWRV